MKLFMKLYNVLSILVILLSIAGQTWAVPVNADYQVVRHADNSELVVAQFGDEDVQWLETPRGEIVLFNRRSGNYEYATIGEKNGKKFLKPSGIKVVKFVPTLEEKMAQQKSKNNPASEKFVPLMRNDILSLRKTITTKNQR